MQCLEMTRLQQQRKEIHRFYGFAMEARIYKNFPNLLPLEAEATAGILNLSNLPFSKFDSQSIMNSESNKLTRFRIGTDATQP